VKPILRAAVALFRRHQHPRQDQKEAQSRLQERALIDRTLIDRALIDWALIDWALIDWAKALLIKQRRLSEPDAYEWFRRNAMSSSRRIVDVASEVVKGMEGNTG
jgi:response regulator NasT